MSEEVTARLEAVAARLERVAAKLGGGGGDDDEVPIYVADYEAIINKEVKDLAETIDKIGLEGAKQPMLDAFANSLQLVKRIPKSKKPSVGELNEFLSDGKAAYEALNAKAEPRGKAARKSDRDMEMIYTAVREAANSTNWPKYAAPGMTPKQFIAGDCGATSSTKITQLLLKCKDDGKKQKGKDISPKLKALFDKLEEFVKEYFKTGVDWNPKGVAISEASASGGSGGGGDDEKKESAATKKKGKKKAGGAGGGGGGGMAAVMGDLSKGLSVTKGMKKVTSSMKTKNRKDRSGKVAAPKKPVKKNKRKKFGPPTTKFMGGRWMVENYDESPDILTVEKANLKSNVFITMCDMSTINITNKVKAVTIDNCVKCRIFVNQVVSTVEIVNCKSCKVIVVEGGKVPSFAVDKCESPQIILSRSAYEAQPDIYSSNVSAMNVEVPGKTENDDNKEFPIPEQFLTKIDCKTGVCTTTPTEH